MTPPLNRREFLRGAVALGAGVALLPRIGTAITPDEGMWFPGDLHCHTVYSHDVWGGPGDDNTELDEAYTFGWTPAEQIAIAELRELRFLAITDHNDVRALTDTGYVSRQVGLIPGYEHSLRKGHAGCLGIDHRFEIDTSTDAGAIALRDAVHAEGGIFILNHPFYGGGWGYTPDVRPDSIEVWNIGWPYRHVAPDVPPEPAVSDNYKSLPYWENEFLASGPMPATGGSDNHYRATTAVQGVGQPTTWVFARDNSWPAILDGILAGRTTVSAEPPSMLGAQIQMTAQAGPTTWTIGDIVPASAGSVTVTAQIRNAPGHFFRFVVDGVAQKAQPITWITQKVEITLDASRVNRVRAEVYLAPKWWMAALTSPIYFG